jgi:hypothetical protein
VNLLHAQRKRRIGDRAPERLYRAMPVIDFTNDEHAAVAAAI